MTLDASSQLPYGPLEMSEVYFDHDGPKLFALRSTSLGIQVLAVCTGEDEERVEYLYLALSPDRFRQVRGGSISMREAFEAAADAEIWRVVEDYSVDPPAVTASPIRFSEIPAVDLPTDGARLDLPTPSAPPLDAELLRWQASRSYRTFAALELDATGQNLTEFPIRQLGAIGSSFQDSIDALAQEEFGKPTAKGAIPANITADVQMNVVELRAASFAVVVATDNRNALMDNSRLVEATLNRLLALIEAGHDPDALVDALREYKGRARSKVVNLLRAVVEADSGLGVVIGPQRGESAQARLSAVEARNALTAVLFVKPDENQIDVSRGFLTGSNTRTGFFELESPEHGRRFSGKVAETAITQIDGLRVGATSAVRAAILESVEFSPANPDGGRKYSLLDIQELVTDSKT